MRDEEIIRHIKRLYEKYEVDKNFYTGMDNDAIIRGMKGILAELDQKKKNSYDEEDLVIIKNIYGLCC